MRSLRSTNSCSSCARGRGQERGGMGQRASCSSCARRRGQGRGEMGQRASSGMKTSKRGRVGSRRAGD
eukprot:187074-Chlamydomonas_euryale.AAC.1